MKTSKQKNTPVLVVVPGEAPFELHDYGTALIPSQEM